ncbi:hypothetical protein L195_g043750 [Trifolium pratense]|uniref:Uncharacterized protein n=1 Tax=Trifolium pratense TaxID=57577 RepID=A0A2K3MA47_TRIPR|nr:hypothetical protein L195_g043750 [Trifolium pratense]
MCMEALLCTGPVALEPLDLGARSSCTLLHLPQNIRYDCVEDVMITLYSDHKRLPHLQYCDRNEPQFKTMVGRDDCVIAKAIVGVTTQALYVMVVGEAEATA